MSYAKVDKVKKIRFAPSLFLYEAGLIRNNGEYKKLLDGEGGNGQRRQ